ncbi:MAG: hypothetical protein GKR88_15805 [Flavobacteriaceae bacterium]|nr:MAG: hypothetical protein GKR88_15805 [Flavobacteriaceae bacterium]
MRKLKYLLKTATLFLALAFVANTQHLVAQSQGPVAPEAASFEPVDAADMVNLVTGDLTYVLLLLNVPSPEGGYPVALAYHAGIAMDQEASWTGLGWNLNAGAINRAVNGYPDDYNTSLINEYFYDEGDEISVYTYSHGISLYGGVSVGLGLSWGSNRSLGGFVSVGYGFEIEGFGNLGGNVSLGTDGVGFGVGATLKGGMTFGVSASSNGGVNGSIGYFDNNSGGFSISTNGSLSVDLIQNSGKDNQVAVGLTLSSSGISIDAKVTNRHKNDAGKYKVNGGVGIGLQLQFENTFQMGDYTTETSSWQIPLIIPTPVGIFSMSFGKQEFRYYLGKNENDFVSGPVYYAENIINNTIYKVSCVGENNYDHPISCGNYTTNSYSDAENFAQSVEASSSVLNCSCRITAIGNEDAFMDIYEVPLTDTASLSENSKIAANNPVFPSYDYYNVQAQGLSGGMSSRLFDNGVLFGLTGRENKDKFSLEYAIDGSTTSIPNHAKFTQKPYFYFDNEISTHLGVTDVEAAVFNTGNQSDILSYYSGGVETNTKPRRKNATYIAYFSNEEITDDYAYVKSKGYLLPSGTGFDRIVKPKDGIGAFKITSIDGKTYHYSLPVYNHETITRTFGIIEERPDEDQSYFEKRQLEPYATHWLLTAVTGPDYYDTNNNGKADEGDYGYWVTFDYGKWSDAFIWKNPYGQDYLENDEDPDIKTAIRGRKEVYYLDKIQTRTHTALFLKSERQDGLSQEWNYKSVEHVDGLDQTSAAYRSRFVVPAHAPLKLDKIILVKNEYMNVVKTFGTSNHEYAAIYYNDSDKPIERAYYKLKDNVFDMGDNWQGLLANASKVIDLTYEHPTNSLAKGSPNTSNAYYGRLTLKSVNFKGKYDTDVMPPYVFSYHNDLSYYFDMEDKDDYGYYKHDNSLWSLNEIITPQGGKIQINYGHHSLKSAVASGITFRTRNEDYKVTEDSAYNDAFILESSRNIGMAVGDKVHGIFNFICSNFNNTHYCNSAYSNAQGVNVQGDVLEELGENKFRVYLNYDTNSCYHYYKSQCSINTFTFRYHITRPIENIGGIRVASLTTTDGINNYTTAYQYGENGNGIGYVSYLPFAPEIQKELPYSAELPAPRVMYEYVSMETKNTNHQSEGKTTYKFKVLKQKDPNALKFGDLYEINMTGTDIDNTAADKKVNISSYTIKDNLATLGSLLEVAAYNSEGQLLSKIENEYYAPGETPGKLGMTQESYQSYKTVDYVNNTSVLKDKWLINSSTRIKYPSLLKKSTEIKTGNHYSSEFYDLDPITGQARVSYSYSSDGIKLKTKTIPAYTKYAAMGSKVDHTDNVNMLAQETAGYSYLIDPVTGSEKVIGASVSTWNNDWVYRDATGVESSPTNSKEKIWRKHKIYVWEGPIDQNGAYVGFNSSNDDDFNWGVGVTQSNTKWKNVSEIARYDHFSSVLEMEDINGNHAASKKGDNHSKVIATANAAYTEMFYSGAEYISSEHSGYFDGEIRANGISSREAHTGNYSVRVTAGQPGFITHLKSGEHRAGKYKISVWVHKDNYENARIKLSLFATPVSFNGEKAFAGDWVLMNRYQYLSANANSIHVTSHSGAVYFDDFRIHPISSSMTSYVYNEFDEVCYIMGTNGLSTHYIYDEAGRLKETRVEVLDNPEAGITGGFKKVSKHTYNYKN